MLWLHATNSATLSLTGTYSDPTNRPVPVGGEFLPGAGLEACNLASSLSDQGSAIWPYDSRTGHWLFQLPPPSKLQSDLPTFMPPGGAVFVRADAPAQFEVPASARRISYYHQDHLGSASCVSDADAKVIDELAFYPFGSPRLKNSPSNAQSAYGFTQHELDLETGFSHHAARPYLCALARFASVDPLFSHDPRPGASDTDPSGELRSPEYGNLYAYGLSNPMKFTDPDGRKVELLGSDADIRSFTAIAQKATGLNLEFKGGELVVKGERDTKVGSATAAKVLTTAIQSKDSLSLSLVNADPTVFGDSFATKQVDVADLQGFSAKSTRFGAAILTHIIAEQAYAVLQRLGV